jgi:hypothetical protein
MSHEQADKVSAKKMDQRVTQWLVWQWVRMGLSAQQIAHRLKIGREEPLDRDSRGDHLDYRKRAVSSVVSYLRGKEVAYGDRAQRGELAFALYRAGAFDGLTATQFRFKPVVMRALLPVVDLLPGWGDPCVAHSPEVVDEKEVAWIQSVGPKAARERTARKNFKAKVDRLMAHLVNVADLFERCSGWTSSSALIHPSCGADDLYVELQGEGMGVHKFHVPRGTDFPFPSLQIPAQPIWLSESDCVRDRLLQRLGGALDVLRSVTPPPTATAREVRLGKRLVATVCRMIEDRLFDMATVMDRQARKDFAQDDIHNADRDREISTVDWDADDGLLSSRDACDAARQLHGAKLEMTDELEKAGVYAHSPTAQPIIYPSEGLDEHVRMSLLLRHVAVVLGSVHAVVDHNACRDLPKSLTGFGLLDFNQHSEAKQRRATYRARNNRCCKSDVETFKAALHPPCHHCLRRLMKTEWFDLEEPTP